MEEIKNENIKMNDGLDDLFYFVDHNSFESEKITAPRYSYWKSVGRVFFKKKSNWVFLTLFVILLLMTYVWPIFHPYTTDYTIEPNVNDLTTWNLSPGEAIQKFGFNIKWIFGTNDSGVSVWNQLWSASQTSLSLAFVCTLINMTIGVVIGAIWGLSKTVDAIMNQVLNIVGNIPYILLISVLVYVIGTGFWPFVLALTITGWLGIAYFIRTQVIIIRDREYNLASKCLGTSIWTIIFKNILPYMISVIVTVLASELPSYISYEVFLSYIGIGLGTDTVSIGRMINEANSKWLAYPWRFWPPVAISAIVSVVLYVVGQNIGDASDPRTHMM